MKHYFINIEHTPIRTSLLAFKVMDTQPIVQYINSNRVSCLQKVLLYVMHRQIFVVLFYILEQSASLLKAVILFLNERILIRGLMNLYIVECNTKFPAPTLLNG